MMPRALLKSPFREIALCLGLALVAYLPVMAHVSLRPTGDEKVYVAQALEMAHNHTWYAQTLAGVPDYYKGPLFYVLLRLGFLIFGETSPWALSWMNFAGLVVMAYAMGLATWRSLRDRGAVLVAVGTTLLAAGVFAHTLAAQMEALLVVAYGVSASLVVLAPPGREGFWRRAAAWVVIGVAGWLKSPVHAVLLGVSALIYWLLVGELRRIATSWRDWLAAVVGVVVGVAGYLPSFLFDHDAFWSTFIQRENLSKGGNGVSVLDSLSPLFSSHFLPWTPLLALALVARVHRRTGGERRLLRVALAWTLPTAVFFALHPYRSGIYDLPVLPVLSFVAAVGWRRSFRAPKAASAGVASTRRVGLVLAAIAAGVAALGTAAVIARFSPLPEWWGATTTPLACVGLVGATVLFWRAAGDRAPARAATVALVAMTLLLFGAGRVFIALGAKESAEARALARALAAEGHDDPWYKLDLTRHLWNEWGLLNAVLDHAVAGVHSEEELRSLLGPDRVFLAPDDSQLATLQRLAATRPDLELDVRPWHRWNIHGETADGTPAWAAAWKGRTLAPLEHVEAMVVVRPHAVVARGP